MNTDVISIPDCQKMNWPTVLTLAVLHVGAFVALFMFNWPSFAVTAFLLWMETGLGISMGYHRLHTVDGLYHELQFKTAVQFGQTPPDWGRAFHQHVVTWEFPFLLKYRFKLPLLKPFVAAGPAYRVLGNLSHTNPSNHGIAAGLGFEAHLWKLNIAPQFRYCAGRVIKMLRCLV